MKELHFNLLMALYSLIGDIEISAQTLLEHDQGGPAVEQYDVFGR